MAGSGPAAAPRTSVVIATHQRCELLRAALDRLSALPERPDLIVVDNASTDGTASMVRRSFPDVTLIRLPRNIAAAARNHGVVRASTDYVAFCDDDSSWEPGALRRAAEVFDRHPALGALAARTLVGTGGALDPVSRALASSPLPRVPELPGPAALGFLACSTVVRRSAFLEVGGFEPLLFVGGEETVLAYDLAAAGWHIAYVEDVVARHFPAQRRDNPAREVTQRRNEVLTCWLRRPPGQALARSLALARSARRDPVARRALLRVALAFPRALRRRRTVPAGLEARIRLLENAGAQSR